MRVPSAIGEVIINILDRFFLLCEDENHGGIRNQSDKNYATRIPKWIIKYMLCVPNIYMQYQVALV